MARSSLIPGRVKNTGVDLLVAGVLFGGALIGLSYANKKFGILNKFVSGATSLGLSVGQAVGAGVSSIPTGIGQGSLSVFSPTGDQNTAVRNALGLPADTKGCLTIPFTNIPLPGQNCSNAVNQANNSLPATASGAQGGIEANKQATSNTAGGVSTVINRDTGRSSATNQTQYGSNLIPVTPTTQQFTQASNILQGTSNPVNLAQSANVGIKAALNSLVSSLNTSQSSALVGQTTVGNYIVPGGNVVPLTQSSVDYYNKLGVRITRV